MCCLEGGGGALEGAGGKDLLLHPNALASAM